MPIVLKKGVLKLKDRTSGEYRKSINAVAEQTTEDMIEDIQQEGATQIGLVEAKGESVMSDIPASYDDLNNIIAESYDSTKTYNVGDYVRYYDGTNDKLYRCTISTENDEDWVSAHWTEVIVSNELSEEINSFSVYKKSIENASFGDLGNTWLTFKKGRYKANAFGTPTEYEEVSYMVCAISPCEVDDIFTAHIYGGTGVNRAWVLLDSDMNVIDRAGTNLSFNNEIKITNSDAAYIAFNNMLERLEDGYFAFKGISTASISDVIFQDIKEIREDIGYNESDVSLLGVDEGYYWNAASDVAVKTEHSSYKAYNPLPVQLGDHYSIQIYNASGALQHPILLVDDDYKIIKYYDGPGDYVNDFDVMITTGITKILLTTKIGHAATVKQLTLKPIPKDTLVGVFDYLNKNVAIIGDSISTNGDYSISNPLGNVPEIIVGEEDIGVQLSAYVTYYDIGTTIGGYTITESDVGTEITFTPIDGDQGKYIGKPKNNNVSTTDVWWEVASNELGFNPIPVCWSSSSITDHEENTLDDEHYVYKCSHSFHPSQIRKCGIRVPGSMTRTAPDMIIIYRGTNDLSHSPYSRITDDLDSFPVTYPETDTYDDSGTTRYSFVKGMRLLIKRLRDTYPETKIVLCTLNYFRRLSTTSIYTSNGIDNWIKYNEMIRRLADYESCDLIDFAKDGLTYWNAANGYYNEGSSSTAKWTHPNTKGQKLLGNRAIIDLRKINDTVTE